MDLTQLPDWKDLPVQACTYTDTQFEEDLLFPTAKQLASWVVSACVDAGRKDLTTCTGRLTSRLWYASNAQFPVAGYVVEPAQGDWKYPNDPYCLLFRDGVTVTTDSYPDTTHAVNNACGPAKAAFEPAVKAFLYGPPRRSAARPTARPGTSAAPRPARRNSRPRSVEHSAMRGARK